jgi:NADPH-dependent 2,4-dienoyl-CoA reductase/sulfur reductase-like enzyme
MEKERFIVIGGVAAGMSGASRARKLRPDMEIIVFEKSGYVSYAACGMPYFVADKVKTAESLVVYDASFFRKNRNITVFLHHEVKRILTARKTVAVEDQESGKEETYEYDKLLISTGARPFIPPAEGTSLRGIFGLRRLEDGIAIKEYILKEKPKAGLIIGGGYIAMEMAEAFSRAGVKVTVVEKMPEILGTMDREITEPVEKELERNGVTLIKSDSVTEFTGKGSRVIGAVLGSGSTIAAEIVLIGAGIKPNSAIAKEAGIQLGAAGAIGVDAKMETSIPGVYAAGDCAEAYHLVLGRNVYVPLGTTANKQGNVAGENVAGGAATFRGIVGTAVFKTFDLEVGRTGITEKEAVSEHVDYVTNVIEHISRAHYYPGVSKILVKLVADRKTGRLLGAQMAGREGVGKRIDVFATAITAGMSVEEIAKLDLGYAPPFGPVYDPVLVAAEQLRKKVWEKRER